MFVINFSVGSWIIAVTGIPASSAFVTGVTGLFCIVFTSLTVRRFWSITVMVTVFSILTIPTPLGGAPPGFLLKVPISALAGLAFDATVHLMGYNKKGFYLAVISYVAALGILLLPSYLFLGLPGGDKVIKALPIFIISFTVLGFLGTWLAMNVFQKVHNKSIIKQIQA